MGRNFNDLPALPLHPGFGGVGGSGAASGGAGGGSAASAIPVEQKGDNDSRNPDDFMVQVDPSAGEAAASGKRSLENDVAASASGPVPKRPRRSCTLRLGKRYPNYLHVV